MPYLINDKTDEVYITPKGFSVEEVLPSKNYILNYDKDKGVYLLKGAAPFKIPTKIYGGDYIKSKAKDYIKTFKTLNRDLGILLRGVKGTGKTLLAKSICLEADLPVIMISEGFVGSDFLTFLSSIDCPCIIFIDEFEKLYGVDQHTLKDSQDSLLSLMDGSISSGNKIFILTANDGNLASSLLGRPGRIRYDESFDSITEEVKEEVIQDLLKDKSKKEELERIISHLPVLNLDSLVSLLEEINLFPNIKMVELANRLNIYPEGGYYIATWSEGNSVSLGGGKGRTTTCIIEDSNPLSSDYINLPNQVTLKGNSYISMSETKLISISPKGEVVLRYQDTDVTFTPFKREKFRFK
jgi:hypothetical protein